MDLINGDRESNPSVDDYSWIFDTLIEPLSEDEISLENSNVTTFQAKTENSNGVSTEREMLHSNPLNSEGLKITGNARNVFKKDLSKQLSCLKCKYTTNWPSYLRRHELKHQKKPEVFKCSVAVKKIDSCRPSNRKIILERNELLASTGNRLKELENVDRTDNSSATSIYLNKIEPSVCTGLGLVKNKEIEKRGNYAPSSTNQEFVVYSSEMKLQTKGNPTLNKKIDEFKHLDTISESKKYKCEFCEFASNYSQNILRHALKKHRDVLLASFPCGNQINLQTNKEIAQDKNKHLKNVSQSKKFKCDFCEFESNYPQNLPRHALKKHRDKMLSNPLTPVCVIGNAASCSFPRNYKIFKTSESVQQNSQICSYSNKVKSSSIHHKSVCPNNVMRNIRQTKGSDAKQLKKIAPILATKKNSRIKLKSLSHQHKSKNLIVKCQMSNNITRYSLKKHRGNKLSNNQKVTPQIKRKRSSPRLSKCNFCNFKTRKNHDLVRHFLTKHSGMPVLNQPTFKFVTSIQSEPPNISTGKPNFCANISQNGRKRLTMKENVNVGKNSISSTSKENINEVKHTLSRKLCSSNQNKENAKFIEDPHQITETTLTGDLSNVYVSGPCSMKLFSNSHYTREKNKFKCSLCNFNTRWHHSVIRHIRLKHNIFNQTILNHNKNVKNPLQKNICSMIKRSEKGKLLNKPVRSIEMFSKTLDMYNKVEEKDFTENAKNSVGKDKLFSNLSVTKMTTNFKNESKSCMKNYKCLYCNYESKCLTGVRMHVLYEHKDIDEIDKHVKCSVLSSQHTEKVITSELVHLSDSNLIDQEKVSKAKNSSSVVLEVGKGVELASCQLEKPFKWKRLSLDANDRNQNVCVEDKNDPRNTNIESPNDHIKVDIEELPNRPISSNIEKSSNNPREVNIEKSNSQCDMVTITRKCNDILESILASLVPGRNVPNKSIIPDCILTTRYSEKAKIEPLRKNAIDSPGNEDDSSNSHSKITWSSMQEGHEVTHSLVDSCNRISRNRSTVGIDESLSLKHRSCYNNLNHSKPSISETAANKEVDIDSVKESKDLLPKSISCNANNLCTFNHLSHNKPKESIIEVISPTNKLQKHDIQNVSQCDEFSSTKEILIHKYQLSSSCNFSPAHTPITTKLENLSDSKKATNIKCHIRTHKKSWKILEKKNMRSKGNLMNTCQNPSYEFSKSGENSKVERCVQSETTKMNGKSGSSKSESVTEIELCDKEVSPPVDSLSPLIQNTKKKDVRISCLNSCNNVSIPEKSIHFDSLIEPRLTRSNKSLRTKTNLQNAFSQVSEDLVPPNTNKLQSNMEVVNSQPDSPLCESEVLTIPLEPIVVYVNKQRILKCSQCSFKTRRGKYQINRHLASHIKLPLNCTECNDQLETVRSLKHHMKIKHNTQKFVNKYYKCIHCKYQSFDPRVIKLHELRYGILGYCNREILNSKNDTFLTPSKSLNADELVEKPDYVSDFAKSNGLYFKNDFTQKYKKVATHTINFESPHEPKSKRPTPETTMEQIQSKLKATKQDYNTASNLKLFRKGEVNSEKVVENVGNSKSTAASEKFKNMFTQTTNISTNSHFQSENLHNQLLKRSVTSHRTRAFKCFHCEYKSICNSNFKRHLRNVHRYKSSFLKSPFKMVPIGSKNMLKNKGKTPKSVKKTKFNPSQKHVKQEDQTSTIAKNNFSLQTENRHGMKSLGQPQETLIQLPTVASSLSNHTKRQPKNLKKKVVCIKNNGPEINILHCPHCMYKSKSKYNLNCHMKSVHGIKPQSSSNKQYFHCSQCNFKSVWKKNVKRHMQLIHHLKPPSKTTKTKKN